MNKYVKCDSCGLTLNVPQKNNDPVRIIRCPNCSHQLRVEFGPQSEDSGETVYGGGKTNNRQSQASEAGATIYAQKKIISKGMLKCDGKLYPLHIGRNIVGRKAPSSEADVQIDSIDRRISRQHAIIKMTRVADGTLRTLISCTKDRLTTIVGGQSLSVGDEVILTNGINLTLGQTSLVYIEE